MIKHAEVENFIMSNHHYSSSHSTAIIKIIWLRGHQIKYDKKCRSEKLLPMLHIMVLHHKCFCPDVKRPTTSSIIILMSCNSTRSQTFFLYFIFSLYIFKYFGFVFGWLKGNTLLCLQYGVMLKFGHPLQICENVIIFNRDIIQNACYFLSSTVF